MANEIENPAIRDIDYDFGKESYCPCCGEECEEFYTLDGKIIGCPNCIKTVEAWEWEEEYDS